MIFTYSRKQWRKAKEKYDKRKQAEKEGNKVKSNASTRLNDKQEYKPDQQVDKRKDEEYKNDVIFEQQPGSGDEENQTESTKKSTE